MASFELFAVDWRDVWNGQHEGGGVGAVYTKPQIVELILDLSGYVSNKRRLSTARLLEPSCGDGAFLTIAIRRLFESERFHNGAIDWANSGLDTALRAVDISDTAIEHARADILQLLVAEGCDEFRARNLAATWTRHEDFLLSTDESRYDFVVGNPPYVRLEDLPKAVLATYRRRYATLTDRADIYVAFIEQGLRSLNADGVLAFIVANRFTKNRYGAALRRMVGETFHVRHYINLEHTQPFAHDVSAYPSIVTIDRATGEPTLAGECRDLDVSTLDRARASKPNELLSEFRSWYPDGAPWRSTTASDHATFDWLDTSFPLLEDSGGITKAGIGVATGADEVFVLDTKSDLIESSRQIPLVLAGDINPKNTEWSRRYLVNPFADADDGSLAELENYPGLRAHFEKNADRLHRRHVAKARPRNWYRTIDRIWPQLQHAEKLIIPDIQPGGVVGYDNGQFYPHHNVYWITSDTWNLRALQAILRSSIVLMQVKAFSVQMRGGSLRYQTQSLRRLRVPAFASLSEAVVQQLRGVGTSSDQEAIDAAAREAFRI